jgi:hypothetical protein
MKILKKLLYFFVFVVFLFLPLYCSAYINRTNSIASLVVGQADMNSGSANQGGAISANGLDNPLGVTVYNSKMFIADSVNNRILIYNSIPSANNPAANVVIGQADMTSGLVNQGGAVGANTLHSPRTAYVYSNKLFVVDRDNHRVLIFNLVPTSNNASADVVIGQPNMISNSANQGLANPAANTLRSPRSVLVVGGKLFITDCQNNRVLIYNSIPTADNASADTVIGQADMVSDSANQGGAIGANTLYNPRSIFYTNGKLIVSELQNNRVLIYNSIPTANNASANVVIGQTDFNSGSANQGGSTSANGLSQPHGLFVDAGKENLFVDDYDNNRLLIYNSIPTANNAPTDVVIGQPDMTSGLDNQGLANPTAYTISHAIDNFVYGGYIYLADEFNSRVLAYKLGPENTSVSVLQILNTNGNNVRLGLSAIGAYQMMISNYPDFRDGVWESYATTKDWTLLGDGAQTVYAKFRDYALYESEPVSVLTNLPQTGRDSFWLNLPLIINHFEIGN